MDVSTDSINLSESGDEREDVDTVERREAD